MGFPLAVEFVPLPLPLAPAINGMILGDVGPGAAPELAAEGSAVLSLAPFMISKPV